MSVMFVTNQARKSTSVLVPLIKENSLNVQSRQAEPSLPMHIRIFFAGALVTTYRSQPNRADPAVVCGEDKKTHHQHTLMPAAGVRDMPPGTSDIQLSDTAAT
jgi:hypothetical protein